MAPVSIKMRTICFYLATLLLCVLITAEIMYAQKGSRIGLRGGPLISWTHTVSPDTGATSVALGLEKPGFAFDLIYTLGFSDNIMLKTGLTFATKHARMQFLDQVDGDALEILQNSDLRTLEIPLGVKVRAAALQDGLYLIGHLGANAEYNFKSTYEVVVTQTPPTGPPTVDRGFFDSKVWLQPVVVALSPGVGLDWEFDWGMLELAATYQVGLTRYHRYFRSRTQALVLGLGYFF